MAPIYIEIRRMAEVNGKDDVQTNLSSVPSNKDSLKKVIPFIIVLVAVFFSVAMVVTALFVKKIMLSEIRDTKESTKVPIDNDSDEESDIEVKTAEIEENLKKSVEYRDDAVLDYYGLKIFYDDTVFDTIEMEGLIVDEGGLLLSRHNYDASVEEPCSERRIIRGLRDNAFTDRYLSKYSSTSNYSRIEINHDQMFYYYPFAKLLFKEDNDLFTDLSKEAIEKRLEDLKSDISAYNVDILEFDVEDVEVGKCKVKGKLIRLLDMRKTECTDSHYEESYDFQETVFFRRSTPELMEKLKKFENDENYDSDFEMDAFKQSDEYTMLTLGIRVNGGKMNADKYVPVSLDEIKEEIDKKEPEFIRIISNLEFEPEGDF